MAQEASNFTVDETIDNILCWECKISIQPNTTNMCLKCLCSKLDITEDLLRHLVLVHCPECESYLQPPITWDKSLLTSTDLVEYIVLNMEVVSSEIITLCDKKYVLADAQVVRLSDIGKNETIFSTRTHLGYLLMAGDLALGYDLYRTNKNDTEYDKHKGHIPEVILIKKSDEENRCWMSHSWDWESLHGELLIPCSEIEQLLKDIDEPYLDFSTNEDEENNIEK